MEKIQTGSDNKTPRLLWIVGGFGVVWNGLGTVLWGGTSFMPDTFLEGQPATYVSYVTSLPVWLMLSWGLGVLAGVAGSILLLMRNRYAVPVFAISLIGAAVNQAGYIPNPPPEGFLNLPLVLFIISSAVFLLWFAILMKRRTLLN